MFETKPVSQCLGKKLKFLGFEMLDLLAISLSLSILNLLFGQSDLKVLLVWTPPTILALTLYFGKKGKPDNYMLHWLRFQMRPGSYSAFSEPTNNPFPPNKRGL